MQTRKKFISWNSARWLRTMTWATKKNPHVLDMGLPPFSAFKVCHLVSKSLYCPTTNPKVMEESNFESWSIFKCRYKKNLFWSWWRHFWWRHCQIFSFGKMAYSALWLKLWMRVSCLTPSQKLLKSKWWRHKRFLMTSSV